MESYRRVLSALKSGPIELDPLSVAADLTEGQARSAIRRLRAEGHFVAYWPGAGYWVPRGAPPASGPGRWRMRPKDVTIYRPGRQTVPF